MKVLVVVDMQNDFIDGSLGTKEAQAIIPKVCQKIEDFDGDIYVTQDTHFKDYLDTNEGKHLPVKHCIFGTEGWDINKDVMEAISHKDGTKVSDIYKRTFGTETISEYIVFNYGFKEKDLEIELIGLCTDICVVTNALILKTRFPEATIKVDSSCCAGVTPESHQAALTTMKMCQIEVI